MTNQVGPDELLVELRVPVRRERMAYLKLGRKHASTPSVVTVAVRVEWRDQRVAEARVALGAVGPHPIRAVAAERLLVGSRLEPDEIEAAATSAARECQPFTDGVATDWYRRRMAGLFVRRALEQLAPGARGEGR